MSAEVLTKVSETTEETYLSGKSPLARGGRFRSIDRVTINYRTVP